MENEPLNRYTPTLSFRLAALLSTVVSVWFGIDVWLRPRTISAFIFAGLAVITLGMVVGAFAHAEFDGDTLVYRVPLRSPRVIPRKQIISATLEGRWTKALVIGFHPRVEDGRIELERAEYVNFVPLQNQDDLLDLLVGTNE